MDETTFLAAADKALEALQDAFEAEYDDLDCTRSGNVLTIELESGAQVVVNIQTPMREIWLASHFRRAAFRDAVRRLDRSKRAARSLRLPSLPWPACAADRPSKLSFYCRRWICFCGRCGNFY